MDFENSRLLTPHPLPLRRFRVNFSTEHTLNLCENSICIFTFGLWSHCSLRKIEVADVQLCPTELLLDNFPYVFRFAQQYSGCLQPFLLYFDFLFEVTQFVCIFLFRSKTLNFWLILFRSVSELSICHRFSCLWLGIFKHLAEPVIIWLDSSGHSVHL